MTLLRWLGIALGAYLIAVGSDASFHVVGILMVFTCLGDWASFKNRLREHRRRKHRSDESELRTDEARPVEEDPPPTRKPFVEKSAWLRVSWTDESCERIVKIEIDARHRTRFGSASEKPDWRTPTTEDVNFILKEMSGQSRDFRVTTSYVLKKGLEDTGAGWSFDCPGRRIETRFLAFGLDETRVRVESAIVRKGRFSGRDLAELSRTEFLHFGEEAFDTDRVAIALANMYYERVKQERAERDGPSKEKTRSRRPAPVPTSGIDIDLAQARELLDLPEGTKWEEVRNRERALKQKVHPDRGGTDGLFRLVVHATGLVMKDLTEKSGSE